MLKFSYLGKEGSLQSLWLSGFWLTDNDRAERVYDGRQ